MCYILLINKESECYLEVMELLNKKKYKFQARRGSKMKLEIEVKIQELNKEDMEDILHEVASCSHNFYLDLGKKIASDN